MSNVTLTASPELYGALASKLDDATFNAFIADPNGFANLGGVKVSTIANTDGEVNLTLPYYSDIPHNLGGVCDDKMADVGGARGGGRGGDMDDYVSARSWGARKTAEFRNSAPAPARLPEVQETADAEPINK